MSTSTTKTDIPEELPQYAQIEELAQGLKAWDNPQNKFRVLRLHMSADPEKRTEDYLKDAASGMPHDQYLREFELVWRSFEGRPVYFGDWSHHFHVAKENLSYAPHLAVMRGWDFGLTPSCIYAQLMPDMRLYVIRELCEEEMGIERFMDLVASYSREHFPNAKRFIDIVDPAGFQRSQTDERSCVQIMASQPWFLRPVPGIQNPQARKSAVVKFLERNVKGEPAFLISPQCKYLINGFDGGYHYAYDRSGRLQEKPKKNEYSHPHDALQYICTRVFEVDHKINPTAITIPTPRYNLGAA